MTSRAGVITGAIALAVIMDFGGAAMAQQSQVWLWCANRNGASIDSRIRGCTTVIQSGKEPKNNLAIAFSNRCWAYSDKGENDRALQDCNQSIKLNPNYVNAFNNRGNTYLNKGEYDPAIQDFDQAIKLSPNYANAFNNRGDAYLNKGE
jgi:tetratricopeptide (TPR) repeat protein